MKLLIVPSVNKNAPETEVLWEHKRKSILFLIKNYNATEFELIFWHNAKI